MRVFEIKVLVVLTKWHPVSGQGHDSEIDVNASYSLHTFAI